MVRNRNPSRFRDYQEWGDTMEQELARILRSKFYAFACWPYRLLRSSDVDRPMVATIRHPPQESLQCLGDCLERSDGRLGTRSFLLPSTMVFYPRWSYLFLIADGVTMDGLQRENTNYVIT